MAAQAADDGIAVPEVLALLSELPIVTAVTLQGPGTHGGIQIVIRKAAQQQERRTQYRYSWEARIGAAEHQAGGLVYDTATAAYQAAVEAVQAALRNRSDDESAAD